MKTSPTSGQFFGTRQNFNRDSYSVSENDTTILSPVSFWMEVFTFQTLKQNSFHKEYLLEKEQIFYQNFRDKTWFWNKLSQRFRMRIKNFETCQVLKSKTATHGNLKGKYFQEIIVWGKLCFSKSIFCIILHCKKVKFCIFVPCWKTWKEKKRIRKTNSNKIFKIRLISNQLFYMGSNFETRNWKCGRLPANFLQLVKFRIEIFKAC